MMHKLCGKDDAALEQGCANSPVSVVDGQESFGDILACGNCDKVLKSSWRIRALWKLLQ